MKAIRLTVKNIGMIADAVIELNKPLILFYGEIRQGKTTLLNSVKWVFGGSFPTDIIRRGETEALIRLDLDCGSVLRTFYVSRDGSTKARPLVFEKSGVPVRDAVAEIKKLLNPFLLDQDYLRNMTELERKKYFASMFSVDTTDLDRLIVESENKAVETRARLKAYGEIDLTPVPEPANIDSLQQSRAKIIQMHQENQTRLAQELQARREAYQKELARVNESNKAARAHNAQVQSMTHNAEAYQLEIERLTAALRIAKDALKNNNEWLASNPPSAEMPFPQAPDTADLERQLSQPANTEEVDNLLRQAEADKVRFRQFQQQQARQKDREADESILLLLDATVREFRAKKIAKLKDCGKQSGIAGLEFDEAGNFIYEGCQAGMLSTSQLMRLSSQLSALYPDGFGLDLIDRAESLGRSIFDFVDRAKAENKTIMAAIVGEKPAQVPAEVGVFVVENGVVK